jgi:hypothetical protein
MNLLRKARKAFPDGGQQGVFRADTPTTVDALCAAPRR